MGHRTTRPVAVVLLLGLLAACQAAGATPSRQPTAVDQGSAARAQPVGVPTPERITRPNVVLLVTDDQVPSELSAMPKTRRLIGDRGVTFGHAISQYPLCCPARGSLLTGQLPHNHGAMGNEPPWGAWGKFRQKNNTLPVWLQDAGYQTGIVGKYLNGYPDPSATRYVPKGWTDWVVPVSGALDYKNRTVNHNGRLERDHRYQSNFVAHHVTDMIERYSARAAPFFVWGGFLAPHDGPPSDPVGTSSRRPREFRSPYVQPKYRGTQRAVLPAKPNLFEKDRSDKVRMLRKKRPFTRRDIAFQAQQRKESLRSVDDAVARIVHTLERTGELDDTIIVFTSDNGFMLGEHGLDQKIYGYEESITVPLLMAGPGVPVGERRSQLVGLADLAPTILDWTGATPGRRQDGVSLAPVLADPTAMQDRHLLLEAGGDPFPNVKRLYTGVRTSDDKVLLRWWNGWVETYDLTTDPYQLDGTTTPDERGWRRELLRELRTLQRCRGPFLLRELTQRSSRIRVPLRSRRYRSPWGSVQRKVVSSSLV